MTDKLYYKDAYIKEFDAAVLAAEPDGDNYRVVLDATAFFPEEGGQSADKGYIGGIEVLDVKEKAGVIYHIMPEAPGAQTVHCAIDFDARFEKMQCHTAEHILCGIIHRLYGYENVGFHLGDDLVTFDVDGELTKEQIDEVELLANRSVMENRNITAYFPTADELAGLQYRSKLDITDGVRIVEIDGVDMCACCAPHVRTTGEIGVIKIVDFMRHRGGMRLFMQAGYRALCDYKQRYEITRAIGAMTSTPSLEILDSVSRMSEECARLEARAKALSLDIARLMAERVEQTDGNAVYLLADASMDDLREFANISLPKIGGILVALCGSDGAYKYVISSSTCDLRVFSKEMNAALGGKGGGRPEMISGSFTASLSEIKQYFSK